MSDFTYDVRSCYIPRPGFKLVPIDYNNLELLSCASQLRRFYGVSDMANIIMSGDKPTDLHSMFASKLMGQEEKRVITYDDYILNKKDPKYKAYRSKGKPMSLGRPGGMGYDTIRSQCEMVGIILDYKVLFSHDHERTVKRMFFKHGETQPNLRVKRTGFREWSIVKDEVVGIRKALDELYSDLSEFLNEGHKKFLTGEHRFKKNEFGEWEKEVFYRFDSHGVKRDYCNYTAFCNGYLMQTPSAVGAKYAGYKLFREFESTDDVNMLAFVHDEYIMEIRDDKHLMDNVERCSEIMIDSMIEKLGIRVAVEWQIQNYWSKDTCIDEGVCYKSKLGEELQHVK